MYVYKQLTRTQKGVIEETYLVLYISELDVEHTISLRELASELKPFLDEIEKENK